MTSTLKLDLDIVKMYHHIENEVPMPRASKSLNRRTVTHTDRQTHGHTDRHTYHVYRAGCPSSADHHLSVLVHHTYKAFCKGSKTKRSCSSTWRR